MGWARRRGLCLCILASALTGVAVRQQDVDLESDGRRVQLQTTTKAPETCSALHCSKPSIDQLYYANRSGQGLFVVEGKKAQKLSPLLRPGWTYNVRADPNCREPELGAAGAWLGNEAEASVVPWPNRTDPVNRSSIEIFIHPRTELDMRLRRTEAWLCAENDGRSKAVCLCKLVGAEQPKHWAILGSLATMLPRRHSGLNVLAGYWSDLQLSMERRCPSPWVLDITLTLMVVLVTCFLVVAAEAMIARHHATGRRLFDATASESGEKKDAEDYDSPIIVISPWKATQRNVASAFGFVALMIAWQRTKMRLAIEAGVHENFVWFTIFFLCSLGLAGIWRFHHILCREQLVQALLANKVGVTALQTKVWYDRIILGAVCLYVLTFVTLSYNTTKSWPVFAVWLVTVSSTLVGLIWAIYKAAQSAQTVDRDLTKVQVNTAGLASLQCPPGLTVTAFEQVVRICLEGRDPTNKEELQDQKDGRNFKILRDIWWHRRLVYELTESTTGFCVLPSLALAALLLLAACTVQAANFACSGGELSMLEIVTADADLHFEPWRDRLVAEMDTTFNGAVLLASADAGQAKRVTYKMQGAGPYDVPRERLSAAAAHFHLMSLEVPRVATVDVQGLRESQANMMYQVRFAPVSTVPMLVSIVGTDPSSTWRRCAGWGSIPGTILTVPPDIKAFTITVLLTEWVVGVPSRPARDSVLESWTAFEEIDRNTINEEIDRNTINCTTTCYHDPDCLTSFPGYKGCYFAKHRHEVQERSCLDHGPQRGKISNPMLGELCMCEYEPVQEAAAPGCCILTNTSTNMITFRDVNPFQNGARGALMRIWLATAVDEQFFWSDLGQIRLSQEHPQPFRVLAQLWGKKTNGELMVLEVNGTVSLDGDVTLLVPHYDPVELDPEENLRLSVALLLPDRDFAVRWLEHPPAENESVPKFAQCRDPQLERRYGICGGTGKWPVEVMTVEVSHWVGCLDTVFQITKRTSGTVGSWDSRQQHLRCSYEETSPVAWAARDRGCGLLDGSSQQVRDAIAASGDALCVLLNQTCGKAQEETLCKVLSRGFHQAGSPHVEIRNGLRPLVKEKLSPLLVCARDSACPDLLSPEQWEYNNAEELMLKSSGGKQGIRRSPIISLGSFMSAIVNWTRSYRELSKRRAPVIKKLCNTTLANGFSRALNFSRSKPAIVAWLTAPLRTGDVEMFKAVKECFKDRHIDLETLLKPKLGKQGWREYNRFLIEVVVAMWHGAGKLPKVDDALQLLNESAYLAGTVSTRMIELMVERRYGLGDIAKGLPPFNNVRMLTMNLPYFEAVEDLVMALEKTPMLKILRLSCFLCLDRKLPIHALEWVRHFHEKVPDLEHLDICDFDFSNMVVLEHPEDVFSGQKSLKRLTLDGVQIPAEAWEPVLLSVGCLPELELKDMLDEVIVKHLAAGLQKRSRECKQLKVILHRPDEVENLRSEIASSSSGEAPRVSVEQAPLAGEAARS